ncbi:hypothetical protein HPB50_009839 [Hyalomma asiaticum]|uniref:Uncharacterized protein n=1 Tax=Hyalomma asiaticum TaxID=266040 RepID=A0ACB7S1V9_HYAAI|nr:hypothetical protein HPB50_009839 [Hyalomma asiaticum]
MTVEVIGEDISADAITEESGWKTAGARRSRPRHREADLANDIDARTNALGTGQQGAKSRDVKGKVIKAGRMPKLPKEEIKVVVRPQGGLDIVKVGAPTVTAAIFAAAGITAEGTRLPASPADQTPFQIAIAWPVPVPQQENAQPTPAPGDKVSWADTIRGTAREGVGKAPKVPEQNQTADNGIIEALRKENSAMRELLQKLMHEVHELRRERAAAEQNKQPEQHKAQASVPNADAPAPKKPAL